MTHTRSVPRPVQFRSYLRWSVAPLVMLTALIVTPVAILVMTGAMDSSGVVAVATFVAFFGLVDWLVAPWVIRWARREPCARRPSYTGYGVEIFDTAC